MEGKELIIESILDSANKFANALVKSSQNDKDAILDGVKLELEAKMQSDIQEATSQAELIVSRKQAVASLEASKIVLASKQKLIDSVYTMAKKRIQNMTDNIYRDFISGFIKQYAESGDTVIIAERDKKRVSKEYILELGQKMNIVLQFSSDTHDGDGGVILSNNKYDKNLTLDAILKEVREMTESETVKKLFSKK